MTLPTKFARYLVAGGVAAVVDLAGFLALLELGFNITLAAALAFGIAAIVNFAISARFVFATDATAKRFGAFLGFALVGLTINTSVTTFAAISLALPAWLAKSFGIGIAFGFNFSVNHWIVFRRTGA